PVFAESSTWQWRAGQNRLWSDIEGLWMFNASGSAVIGAYAGDGAGGTKSWGGRTLGESDVLIGDEGRGGFLHWDDSAASLLVSGAIEIAEASNFAGSGYLQIGTGTKDSTLDGWNFAAGEIVGQENGVDQVVLSATDGSVRAGANSVLLNVDGIGIQQDLAEAPIQATSISWWEDINAPTGNPTQTISGFYTTDFKNRLVLGARAPSDARLAETRLTATKNNGTSFLFQIDSDGYLTTDADFTLTAAAPTLGTNWAHRSGDNLSARYFANVVNVVGIIDGSSTPSSTLATLAAAYRPSKRRFGAVIVVNGSTATMRRVDIETDGDITAQNWTPANGDAVLFELTYFL
ncbi:MAG: hypothetical protein KDD84_17015, partial [Caldilineaceae bacterium]|nr:hypothetical protein [Caldilineaceae bacterium]